MEEAAQLGTKKKVWKTWDTCCELMTFVLQKTYSFVLFDTQADLCCFVVISSSDIILVHFGECVLIWFCESLGL